MATKNRCSGRTVAALAAAVIAAAALPADGPAAPAPVPTTQPGPDATDPSAAAGRLLAVVADPDADWQDRAAAEQALAALPPERVLPLLVPAMRDRPAGQFYPGAASADADKDAPPEWQAYYAVRRAWDAQVERATGGDADLGPVVADLLPLAGTADARVAVAGAARTWWADRSEPTLAAWLRGRDQPGEVRQAAAAALLHHGPHKAQYYAEVRGLADAAAGPLKGLLFRVLVDDGHWPDPAVVVIGFDLMEQACRGPGGDRAGAEYARRLGLYLRVNFTPDARNPKYRGGGPGEEAFARDTVAYARRWWAEHVRDIEKGAEKVKPGPA